MAGDVQMSDLAEVLAKAAGSNNTAENVTETLNRYLTRSTASTAEQMSGLSAQLDQLRQASQQQANVLVDNSVAVAQNTSAQGSLSLASVVKPSGSILSSIFGNGFGISPLISGIMALFGGGSNEAETAAPVTYEKPAAVSFTGGYSKTSDDRIQALDYAAGDKLRLMREAATDPSTVNATWDGIAQALAQGMPSNTGANEATSRAGVQLATTVLEQLRQPATATSSRSAGGTGSGATPAAWEAPSGGIQGGSTTPQITVQVQAMDSRSFLDHSEDIARAVRQAMLNSHGINDVITEL
jgi:hypothetical protein